jgi:TolB-like protein
MRTMMIVTLVSSLSMAGAAKPTKRATTVAPAPEPQKPVVEAPPTVVPATPTVEPATPPAPARSTAVVGRPRLIVLGLTAAGGVDAALADSFTETLAAEISRTQLFEVTSQKDIATALGIERQKQLLGCSTEASTCMTELADAFGARFVLTGSITKLGDVYQLNLQTQDTSKTQTLGRATRLANDLVSLRNVLPFAIAEATATPPPEPPSKVLPVVLMGTGAAAVVTAGVLFLSSFSREQAAISELALAKSQPQLQLKPASYYAAEAAAVSQLRLIGGIVGGVGAALIVAGIVVYPRESMVRVAVVPTVGGAAVVGSF